MTKEMTKKEDGHKEIVTSNYFYALVDSVVCGCFFIDVFNNRKSCNVSIYVMQNVRCSLLRWLWNESPWKDVFPHEDEQEGVPIDIALLEQAMEDQAYALIENRKHLDDKDTRNVFLRWCSAISKRLGPKCKTCKT